MIIPSPYNGPGCKECGSGGFDSVAGALETPSLGSGDGGLGGEGSGGGGDGGWVGPPGVGSLSGDPVDTATGAEVYLPQADLTAYNPTGPPVSFRRSYNIKPALYGQSSPGLAPGWVHNWDVDLVSTGSYYGYPGSAIELFWPNGGEDVLRPTGSGGGLSVPPGAPYTAVYNATTGAITINWNSGTVWTFTPAGDGITYNLTSLTAPSGSVKLTCVFRSKKWVLARF